ncbi:hypothetical protein GLYMA_13G154350v4 [Glycine max]|nr:hypothetical protein GLYMA_13G154350v4 [Glycine max]
MKGFVNILFSMLARCVVFLLERGKKLKHRQKNTKAMSKRKRHSSIRHSTTGVRSLFGLQFARVNKNVYATPFKVAAS